MFTLYEIHDFMKVEADQNVDNNWNVREIKTADVYELAEFIKSSNKVIHKNRLLHELSDAALLQVEAILDSVISISDDAKKDALKLILSYKS